MKATRNCRTTDITGACRVLLISAALLPAVSGGDEKDTTITHFIDTSTDRVPMLTAFPKYPSVARRDRIEGEATVCFKIRTDGRISRPIVASATHKIFAKPALNAIKKSTFEPLGPRQLLATARTCRIYRFRLDPVLVSNDPE